MPCLWPVADPAWVNQILKCKLKRLSITKPDLLTIYHFRGNEGLVLIFQLFQNLLQRTLFQFLKSFTVDFGSVMLTYQVEWGFTFTKAGSRNIVFKLPCHSIHSQSYIFGPDVQAQNALSEDRVVQLELQVRYLHSASLTGAGSTHPIYLLHL